MSMVQEKMYMDVDDVCAILGVSKAYEILCQSYGTGRVEELVELMLDAICSTKTYQQINGEAVPTQVVKSRLLKVRYEHIQYVFFSLDRSTSKAKNIRQYMLRFLIKLPFRIIAASVWLVLAAVNIVLVKSQ